MFGKQCKFCGEKIKGNFSFCPHCGSPLREKREKSFGHKGLLDEEFDLNSAFAPFASSGNMGFPFDSILNKLIKELDKQMRDLDKGRAYEKMKERQMTRDNDINKIRSSGVSISISQSGNGEPVIRVSNLGNANMFPEIRKMERGAEGSRIKEKTNEKTAKVRRLSKEDAEKIAKLPHAEPAASVRRLADKVVYEIEMPKVKEENVFINPLQNSIEIKAFTKDKVFLKLLPISLPIMKYYLKEGKLVLELKPEM